MSEGYKKDHFRNSRTKIRLQKKMINKERHKLKRHNIEDVGM